MFKVSVNGAQTHAVELTAERLRDSLNVPFIGCAELGYTPLSTAGGGGIPALEQFVRITRDRADGIWFGFWRGEGYRPFAIVQGDRSSGGAQRNFYENNHPSDPKKEVWKDYYYAAAYVVTRMIDRLWRSEIVELAHPTGNGWPPNLAPAWLEGLGHALDTTALALHRVHLNTCCMDEDAGPIRAAVDVLQREQRLAAPPLHRHISFRDANAELGIDSTSGLTIVKVELPRRQNQAP